MPTLRSGKVWQTWYFAIFLSISLPLSRNLTLSLSYHIVRNESRRWQTFSLFALSDLVYSFFSLSELVCTKNVFYPVLLFPTYLPQADSLLERYGWTDFNTSFTLTSFFFHWVRGALPAGATLILGWLNYGVDGRLNEFSTRTCTRFYVIVWTRMARQ